MVFSIGYCAKALTFAICLLLLSKVSITAATTEDEGLPGSFYYGGQPIEGGPKRESAAQVKTIENKTIAKRVLLQRGRQSQSQVQSACELSSEEVERFYDMPSQQWTVNDGVLEELDDDVQAVIECANEDDVVLFRTDRQIKPKRTLILSKNLTIASQSEAESAESEGSASVSERVRLTCPDSGQLIISRSPSFTLRNVVIEDCNTASSVIEMDPDCNKDTTGKSARLHGMIIERNVMLGQGRIISASKASCLHLEMSNILIRRNRCAGSCILLSTNNTLNSITMARNNGSANDSVDSSIFSTSEDSETIARNVTSKNNEIRSFLLINSTLEIANSLFSDNRRNVSSVTRDHSVGGGVLFANRSSISITNAIFERNYALNGGSVFAWSSNVNVTECVFHDNDAGEGDGGAIYGHYNCSFDISSSTFSRNRGYFGAALQSNFTMRVNIVNSRILENSCSRSSAISISEGTTRIESCDFVRNIADRAGAALGTTTVDLVLANSTFSGNIASVGGACAFEVNCTVRGSNLLFENNTAQEVHGGSIYFSFSGHMTIRDSLFQNNYGHKQGGAIHSTGETETVLERTIFLNNTSGHSSGAVHITNGNFTGSSLTFRRNIATSNGGAIGFSRANTVSVFRSHFEENHAFGAGAIQFFTTSSGEIDQCTFVRNVGYDLIGGAIQSTNSNVNISSTLFHGNTAYSGGSVGFYEGSTSAITDTTFESNAVDASGGAITMGSACSLILSNSSFSRNRARLGGVLDVDMRSDASISRVQCVQNYAASFGGCLYSHNSSKVSISDSLFSNNIAETGGGAISLSKNTRLSISNSTLVGNNCGVLGGGVDVAVNSSIELTTVSFDKNEARWGGAVQLSESCNATISNSNFTNNTASSSGGAIFLFSNSTLSLTNSTLSDNKASDGGGLYISNNSTARLLFNGFAGNNASRFGGAICLQASNMLLLSSQLDFNRARFGGSLIAVNASMEVINSEISGNHAHVSGGAIYMEATNATLERVRLELNRALARGGGIALVNASSLLCFSCLIVKNRASSGAGLFVYSNNSIPTVAQLQDSRFENNSARSHGGGIAFVAPQNRSISCSAPNVTCGHIVLLNTSFVDNYANHSGAIVLTTHPNMVLVDCEYKGRTKTNQDFLSKIEMNSLEVLDRGRLCPSWMRNSVSSNAYGDVVGTYGQEIVLTIDPKDEVKLVGSISSGYVLENVRSGRQLPTINVTILDGYGAGPALTLPHRFGARISSPDDFFIGVHPTTIFAGVGNFSRVIGLVIPGNYSLEFAFDNEAFETFNVTVMVRECIVGEERTRDGLTCQECDAFSYNFNASEVGGCKECPENAACRGRYIVPKSGHWHNSPCHDTIQGCLTEEACTYEDREEALTSFTHNSTDCNLNETALDSYNDALCNEGYKGPLCGSCKKSYGLSHRFQCLSCPLTVSSVLTLLGLTIYLLVSSTITIRGTLPSPSSKPKKSSSQCQPNKGPSTSSRDVGISAEIEEGFSQEPNEDEESGAKSKSIVMQSPCSKPMNGYELIKWKTTEILKILINFLQTTAVSATVNVQWTDGVLEVFETSEYVGVLTTAASSRPIDCLISSDSSKTRSISTMLLTLLVPGIVTGIFLIVWSFMAYKKKQNMMYFWKRSFLSITAVTYISYLGLTQLAVRVFYCVDVYDSLDPFVKNKSRYWAVDTAIGCYGKAHAKLIIIAVILLVFVSVGFPLISAIVLTQTKAHDPQSGGWQLETMGFLYRAFKEEYVYWESLVMLRKAFLSVIVVFSYPLGGQIQGLLAALVIVFGLYFHLICSPFRKEFSSLNYYESISLLVSCVTFILGQFFNAEKSSSVTRTMVAVVIIVANASFFACMVFVLFRNVIEQLRKSLQNTNANISQDTPWWKVVKMFITSKLSKMCGSKK